MTFAIRWQNSSLPSFSFLFFFHISSSSFDILSTERKELFNYSETPENVEFNF